MRVVSVADHNACCEAPGVRRDIGLDLLESAPVVGDYVLVHAGYALRIVSEADARETWALFDQITSAHDRADASSIETPLDRARPCVREVTVLGLGNILLSDDGVGVHVARSLAMNPGSPSRLRALDGGTLGFRLMEALIQLDSVLIVDAAMLGERPGAMRLLDERELHENISRSGRMSAHEAGLADMLTLARIEGWAPRNLALLGVQPQRLEWGLQLSEQVAQSVPAVCRAAVETVLTWQAAA
jgi:hydrogenase maturation protease